MLLHASRSVQCVMNELNHKHLQLRRLNSVPVPNMLLLSLSAAQVFLCGVCGPVGGSWFRSSSYQRRPLELLHVWTMQHLRFTAETRRLAQQTTTLLRQQPWAGVCEYRADFRHPSKFWQWKWKGLQSIINCLNWPAETAVQPCLGKIRIWPFVV